MTDQRSGRSAIVPPGQIAQARGRLVKVVESTVMLTEQAGLLIGLCPFHNEKTASFTVYSDHYYCFGCNAHGDAIDFVRATQGLNFAGAVDWILGHPDNELPDVGKYRIRTNPNMPNKDADRKREAARRIWREARPAGGSVVERYLRERGIEPAHPPSLRYHPGLRYNDQDGPGALILPALVAGIQWPDRRIGAIQRTYLDPRGDRKAQVSDPRKTLGPFNGGALRLGPAGPELGIAEGCETGLSAMRLFDVPVWCACGARLSAIDLPPAVKTVHVFADNGAPGREAAERAADRYTHEGRRVELRYPPAHFGDWNDVVRAQEAA